MKIAVVGKGGSGKTTIAGTLARILAQRESGVLAIDGDPNPNLALTLGVGREPADRLPSIPPSLMQVQEDADGGRRLVLTQPEEEVMRTYSMEAPGGVRLIIMGRPPDGSAGSGCMCASHRAVRGLIATLSGHGEYTVTDMEAGLEHLKRGTARNVDVMLIVAEPYYRSLEAAVRTFRLAQELEIPDVHVVANKIKTDSDREAVEEFCGQHDMPILAVVPEEQQFVEAERAGQAPFDFDPECTGVRAIRSLAESLTGIPAGHRVAGGRAADAPGASKRQ
jgi:CO dehydrogenase maturation factor